MPCRTEKSPRYASAVASLDQLLGGLEVMHNSGQFGDLRLHMSFLSFSEGLIMAFALGDPEQALRGHNKPGEVMPPVSKRQFLVGRRVGRF